jgi:hypothetical protein
LALLEVEPLVEMHDAIRSPVTREHYDRRLIQFFDHLGIPGADLRARSKSFVNKARQDLEWTNAVVNEFIRFQKTRVEKGEIAEATVASYWKPVKLLLEQNDIILNWKKISRRIPKGMSFGQDRLPTLEEVKAIMSYPDRRTRPIVLTMVSSGIRVGAWKYLSWGDVTPIERDGKVVAAKLQVYAGTPDRYFTFITPEAFKALSEYMKVREESGETISPSSPLMRNLWYGDRGGFANAPIERPVRLDSMGVKRLIEDAIKAAKLRKPLQGGKKRHEFQALHGFRKLFKSTCEGRISKTLHVEILLGHSIGLNANYYRPTDEELLSDYLRAVPSLTLLEEAQSIRPDLEDRLRKLEQENLEFRQTLKGVLPILDAMKKERSRELAGQ